MKKTYRQRKFEKLTPAEKRVWIAQDVIKLLEKKSFSPQHTYSFFPKSTITKTLGKIPIHQLNSQLNEEVSTGRIKCSGCAKTAIFLSHVMTNNNFRVLDARHTAAVDEPLNKRLKGIFTERALDIIENAYEKNPYFYYNGQLHNTSKAYEFGMKYYDDTERLIAIMKNIIRNKGNFRP